MTENMRIFNLKKQLVISLLLPLLSACNSGSFKSFDFKSSGAGTGNSPGQASSADPDQRADSTNIADELNKKAGTQAYETVHKDGVAWKQGRFEPGSHGGNLAILAVNAEPRTFNPWVAEDAFSLELSSLLFRSLGQLDYFTGEILPDLAEQIIESPDHLTYLCRLRKGLRWSDGNEITAEDVAFSWNTLIAQGYCRAASRDAALVDGEMPVCKVVDKMTNSFECKKAYVPFKRIFSTMKVAPKHIVEPVLSKKNGRSEFKKLWAADGDLAHIVSSGPFTLFDYRAGEKVEFQRSDSFYMIDKNGSTLPYLDRLTYKIETEPGAVVFAFGKHEADLAQFRPKDEPWLLTQQKPENFKLYMLGPANQSFMLVFNMNGRNDPKNNKPIVDPVRSAWFNNLEFRQAVNHALDRQDIIKECFKGAGAVLVSGFPRSSPFYNKSLKAFARDTNFSMQKLNAAGFAKKRDGFLYDSQGNKVEFALAYAASSKFYQTVAKKIAANLLELGMTVNLEPQETSNIEEELIGKKTWDAQLLTLSADPFNPNASSNVFCSNGRLHVFDQRDSDWRGDIVQGERRDWEKQIDDIFAEAACEFDLEKRKALYSQAQKIIYDQAPYIYLVSPDVIIGARNTVRNFSPTAYSQDSISLHNPEEIYLDLSQLAKSTNSTNSGVAGQ